MPDSAREVGFESAASSAGGGSPDAEESGSAWPLALLVGLVLGAGALAGSRRTMSWDKDETASSDTGLAWTEGPSVPSSYQPFLEVAKEKYERDTQTAQQAIQHDTQQSQRDAERLRQDASKLSQLSQQMQQNKEELRDDTELLRAVQEQLQQDEETLQQDGEEISRLWVEYWKLYYQQAYNTTDESEWYALGEEMLQIREEIRMLEEEMEPLPEEILESTNDAQSLDSEIDSLEDAIDYEQEEMSELQDDMQACEDEMERLAEDTEQQVANIEDAESEFEEAAAAADTAAAAEAAALGSALDAVVGSDLANSGDNSDTDNPWNNPANARNNQDSDNPDAEDDLTWWQELCRAVEQRIENGWDNLKNGRFPWTGLGLGSDVKYPSKDEMARRLGTTTDDFHDNIKKAIKNDAGDAMKQLGNPKNVDIGVDKQGNIWLRSNETRRTAPTGLNLRDYAK